MNDYLEIEENNEINYELSDEEISQYMQLFNENIIKGGLLQGCTIIPTAGSNAGSFN